LVFRSFEFGILLDERDMGKMKSAAISVFLAIAPAGAGADERDLTQGGMAVLGEQCAAFVIDKTELVTAIDLTLRDVAVWKSSAAADKLSDFQTGFDEQAAKIEAKPVR